MKHPLLVAWEKKLSKIFMHIDEELENKYGHLYPLHPARPKRGSTANNKYDGLFSIDAAFSPGFGSKHGAGYILELRMVTLHHVPKDVLEKIQHDAIQKLSEALTTTFPGRNLKVEKDGQTYKIHGDLYIGKL